VEIRLILSGRFAVVVLQQAAEPLFALDFAGWEGKNCWFGFVDRIRRSIVETLMRSVPVVVADKSVDQVTKVLFAEDDEMVQAFPFCG